MYLLGYVFFNRPSEHPEAYLLSDFIYNVLMIQAWGFSDNMSWNGVAWSISCEWFVYLIFPFISLLIFKVKGITKNFCFALLSYLIMLMIFGVTTNFEITMQNLLLRVSGSFIAGCFIFNLYRFKFLSKINWNMVTLVTTLAIIFSIIELEKINAIYKISSSFLIVVSPLMGLLVLSLANKDIKFLASSKMIYFGEISYSLYMTHFISIMILKQVLKVSPTDSIMKLSVYLLI